MGFAFLSVVFCLDFGRWHFFSLVPLPCVFHLFIYLFQVIENIVGERFAMTQEWEPLPWPVGFGGALQ